MIKIMWIECSKFYNNNGIKIIRASPTRIWDRLMDETQGRKCYFNLKLFSLHGKYVSKKSETHQFKQIH